MKPLIATTVALDNDDNGICVSQTPAAGGSQDLTITGALATGGVATIAMAQIVTITSAADETGRVFTVTGTDADGKPATETVAGAAVAMVTVGFYKTVTIVNTDDDTAGAIIVGPLSANDAVTKTLRVNRNQSDFGLGLYVTYAASTTLTYSVQFSATDPENGDFLTSSYSNDAEWFDTDGLTSLTARDKGNIVLAVECVRLKVEAYTSGTATLTVQQSY